MSRKFGNEIYCSIEIIISSAARYVVLAKVIAEVSRTRKRAISFSPQGNLRQMLAILLYSVNDETREEGSRLVRPFCGHVYGAFVCINAELRPCKPADAGDLRAGTLASPTATRVYARKPPMKNCREN